MYCWKKGLDESQSRCRNIDGAEVELKVKVLFLPHAEISDILRISVLYNNTAPRRSHC